MDPDLLATEICISAKKMKNVLNILGIGFHFNLILQKVETTKNSIH